MEYSEDQKMRKSNPFNEFSLEEIKTHIESKEFITFINTIKDKNNFFFLLKKVVKK